MGSPDVIAQDVISKLENLDSKITSLLEEKIEMKSNIKKLESEKEMLQDKLSEVKSEISLYLKELEEIKAHYVSSNNNNK